MGKKKKSGERPVPPKAGAPTPKPKPRPHKRRGCGDHLFSLFVVVFFSFLLAVVILVHRPADLSGIQGYSELVDRDAIAGDGGELLDDLLVAKGGDVPLEVGEELLNRYVHSRVVGVQEGAEAGAVRFVGVWLDSQPGQLEVILERRVLGRPSTMSIRLALERRPEQFIIRITGGSYGRLRVPAGFAYVMKPALEDLADALKPELDALFGMGDVAFRPDGIVFYPVGAEPGEADGG